SIKLTTARYYTPSGRSIQATGITPDIVVERARVVEEKNKFGEIHEADLKGALSNGLDDKNVDDPTLLPEKPVPKDLKNKPEADKPAPPAGTETAPASETDDYQLIRAIDLLQGISLYQAAGAPAQPPQAANTNQQKGKGAKP